jgi:CHASE3 domain sensor protein
LQWIGYGALLVALLLLIASATAVSLNLRNLRTNRDLVERTNAILQAAAELQRDIRSAEAGQRGFLLTQDPRYLAPYEVAMLRTPADRARLTALVRHPEQKILLAAMNAPIDAKLAELATTVRLARTDRQRALAVVLSGQGERLMEELDLRFEAFGAGERRLLQERVQAEQAAAARAAQAAAATGLLSLAAALIGLGLLLRFRNVVALREANVPVGAARGAAHRNPGPGEQGARRLRLHHQP